MEKDLRTANRIVWFEIPVRDMDRACKFYESLFGETLRRESMGAAVQLSVFTHEGDAVSGCLMFAPNARPHADGVRVYLDARRQGLDTLLGRVEAAGGKVALPPVQLPEGMGRFAHMRDLDGNVVGLHEV